PSAHRPVRKPRPPERGARTARPAQHPGAGHPARRMKRLLLAAALLLGACATQAPMPPAQQAAPPAAYKSAELRIRAVGDIMLGSDFPDDRLPPDDGRGLLAPVADWLRDADLTFGNVEGVLMDGGEPGRGGAPGRGRRAAGGGAWRAPPLPRPAPRPAPPAPTPRRAARGGSRGPPPPHPPAQPAQPPSRLAGEGCPTLLEGLPAFP